MIVYSDSKAPRIARYSAKQKVNGGEVRACGESRIAAIYRCLDKAYKAKTGKRYGY